MKGSTFDIEKNLDRLSRLVGTDEGFYILALHSFIESFLRYEKGYGEEPRFPELTWSFREEILRERGGEFIDGLTALGRLGKQHIFTNKVRHAFERMDPEEAAAATHLFLRFCMLAGIGDCPQTGKLKSSLDIWGSRTSIIEQNTVIRQMQRELEDLRKEKETFAEQQDSYRKLKAEITELHHRVSGYTIEIQKRTEAVKQKDDKVDELRAERNRLIRERNGLIKEAEQYSRFERYLRYLGRLSLCTRTRMDYEQTIAELTPEQEAALENVKLNRDFLIRGGAGTGKSLVLLESLRRAVEQQELDFGEGESVVLVTFTRTLAKYNRYISKLMGIGIPLDIISTVDKLFYDKLTAVCPEAVYDFNLLDTYIEEAEIPAFISKAELHSELENFIFSRAVTKKEYIDDMIVRTGMRRRLGKSQRREIWEFTERFISRMEELRTYTKEYGRLKLLGYLREHPDRRELRSISYLFLDEVQDLTPAALMVLKALTRRSIIMAGDTGQSLYNYQSPFERAGISLRGGTRVLKTNFRNTRQIHEFAEGFRALSPPAASAGPDPGSEPFTFREGPRPELYTADTKEGLLTRIRQNLTIFIEELGYDPENICILVPRNCEIEPVTVSVGQAGYTGCTITDKEFLFTDTGSVRISTFHSSKGLDFPVVFLYLPYLYRRSHYGAEEEELMLRNLVYVGITRGMDNVLLFVRRSDDPILKDLVSIA